MCWLLRQFASSQTKCWVTDWLLMLSLISPLLLLYHCTTVLLRGSVGNTSVVSWWRSVLTPLSWNMGTAYFPSVSSLNLCLLFFSVLLYSHSGFIWGVLLFNLVWPVICRLFKDTIDPNITFWDIRLLRILCSMGLLFATLTAALCFYLLVSLLTKSRKQYQNTRRVYPSR